jgi:hypothetical protein
VASATTAVDRIAFEAIAPGGSIITGGDLNTLDVFNNLTIGGGPGINIGRDLNWMMVGGNMTVENGSTFQVTRDIGLTAQLPKGSDLGGQGALVQGNLSVDATSSFIVGRSVDAPFIIDGSVTGASRFTFGVSGANEFVIRGTTTS